tara:strand:- start:11360 stop:12535 length:1176 start_codon:yes stop_codon:yes gene_type:complete
LINYFNMTRLTNLIKEVLSTQPKKKDCNCGCNTCDNVGNEGVLLNENKAPKQILSENLQYHVQNKLPLTENTFRYGSESFLNLWQEARYLYLREIIHVNDDDKEILEETDLGNYGMYEGKKVPLGLPMENIVNESFNIGDKVKFVGDKSSFKNLDPNKIYIIDDIIRDTLFNDVRYIVGEEPLKVDDIQLAESEDLDWEDDWEDDNNIYTGPASYGIDRRTWDRDWKLPKDNLFNASKTIKATNNRMDAIRKMLERFPKELDKFENDPNYPAFDMNYDELVKWYRSISNFTLQEAKKKKKKKNPPIGKPKRGGPKAYYVYVRDPKTKRIKKVTFGSGGLKAKINNPKARRAFAKRHRCSEKKDRTKASYWSCRLPRYAKLLGLKSSFSGFW